MPPPSNPQLCLPLSRNNASEGIDEAPLQSGSFWAQPPMALDPEDLAALLALVEVPGMGPRTLQKLLNTSASIQALWEETTPALLKAVRAETEVQTAWQMLHHSVQPMKRLAAYQAAGIHLLHWGHPQYPLLLRQIHNPPVLLFVRGNPAVLSGKTLGVVGTRRASEYGYQVTGRLVQQLAPAGVCIVSGLALGVDAMAHRVALEVDLPTVAVLGCGIDQVYPEQHQDLATGIIATGGAVVSEYPFEVTPDRFRFPQRNRIIAGLSHGVLVVEAPIKSGALITAKLAMDENRTVFAVPGNVASPNTEGPHQLLRQGAVLVTEARHILEELKWEPEAAPRRPLSQGSSEPSPLGPGLTAQLAEVLEKIPFDPTPIAKLQQHSGLEAAQLSQRLTLLELEGLIKVLSGAQVCRL